jgi:4-hydroxyacetophenone monooxygenase
MLIAVRNLTDVALPPLLAALAVVTGRDDLLRPELTLDPARRLEPQGGLDDAQQALARRMCDEALADLDANGPVPTIDDATLRRAMEFCFGEAVGERTFAMLREELSLPGEDPRAPRWSVEEIAPGRTVRAVVIGAGMSGIAAAHRLGQAGVQVRILERAEDLGGTWRDNRYPGCRVDVPNHLYSYSFAAGFDWAQQFSTQPVLLEYFRDVAGRLGVTERIEFGTDVLGARWDDTARVWRVQVRTAAGERTVEAELLVSAVGQLHRPLVPDFEGRDTFAGPAFHTAAWDEAVDLAGRRVAVVGAAASAVQCVPEIARVAEHVTVFQRTPNWFLPAPNYHDDLPASVRAALREIPHLESWYRLWLFWRLSEGLMAGTVPGPANDMFRAFFTAYLRDEFADRPCSTRSCPTTRRSRSGWCSMTGHGRARCARRTSTSSPPESTTSTRPASSTATACTTMPTSSSGRPGSRRRSSSRRCTSSGGTVRTSGSVGGMTPTRTSASRCRTSRICSASTDRTRTSSRTAASSSSRSAR